MSQQHFSCKGTVNWHRWVSVVQSLRQHRGLPACRFAIHSQIDFINSQVSVHRKHFIRIYLRFPWMIEEGPQNRNLSRIFVLCQSERTASDKPLEKHGTMPPSSALLLYLFGGRGLLK